MFNNFFFSTDEGGIVIVNTTVAVLPWDNTTVIDSTIVTKLIGIATLCLALHTKAWLTIFLSCTD